MPLLHVQMPLLYVQMPLLSKPKKTTHLGRSGGPLGGFWVPLGATWTDLGVFLHCKPPSEILESFALHIPSLRLGCLLQRWTGRRHRP